MVPGLPDPHRTFGVMSIVGTPGVAIFANDDAITTTPTDTAYLVSATAAMRAGQFRTYSIERDCEFAADGRHIRFGDDLLIEGGLPQFRLTRRHPDVDVDLVITATDKVSYFADLPGGLYTHWSLLCRYAGTVGDQSAAGLCTFEYAHGIGTHSLPLPARPNLPARFFTYHVLNVDEENQVLFAEVHGPAGTVLLREVYVRGLGDYGSMYRRVLSSVGDLRVATTPAGRPMRLPREFGWSAISEGGSEVVSIEGRSNDDWAYGLGAGFVGSYRYAGSFHGGAISGTGYVEYIDLDTV
jgi:hypothetical protein